MPEFMKSKVPQAFEKLARINPDEARNALRLAIGEISVQQVTFLPKPRVQRVARQLVNLRDGLLVAHDQNFFFAEMYIRTFLK